MSLPNVAQTAALTAAAGGEAKRLTTGDGTNYVSTYSPAVNETLPTFLLLHGYPSSRHDWRYQLGALAQLGYGVLAPDMLGMGDSEKPTNLEAYRSKRISGHLKELVDQESLGKVIGFSGLVFLSSSYFPPGVFFDVEATNRRTLGTLGYTQFGYWYFFNSFDAGMLMSENLESFFHLLYHADAAQWGQNFAMIGAARAWLKANKNQPLPTWLTEEDKSLWLHLYSQPNATEAPLSYYRAVMRGIFEEDEAGLSNEDKMLRVPVVAVSAAKDQICIPEEMTAITKPWTTNDYTEYLLDAGHWVMLEQKGKVTSILPEFARSLTA
ncbi:hypothetical protein PG994_009309 [Apiospora phragmitis]|uniref:AB hydrolase-1 domain-containing protein n=1 Tax=Apiospora phragmitis TaxID=2905665 RepID=A0ABR1UIX7_9PEZI